MRKIRAHFVGDLEDGDNLRFRIEDGEIQHIVNNFRNPFRAFFDVLEERLDASKVNIFIKPIRVNYVKDPELLGERWSGEPEMRSDVPERYGNASLHNIPDYALVSM